MKKYMIFSVKNVVYKLPYDLRNDLKFRNLET